MRTPQALEPFVRAGVLVAADVHVARRLAQLTGEVRPEVLLAAAVAVRGLRLGHTCIEVDRVAATVTTEPGEDVSGLPWPDPREWMASVASSTAVALGEGPGEARPLRLVGRRLYLDRYFRQEVAVAAALRDRAGIGDPVDDDLVRTAIDRLFAGLDGSADQRAAVAAGVCGRLTIVAGGPGTGKTTTVARLVALADEVRGDRRPALRVALAAPTGRAAARLGAAVRAVGADLDVAPDVAARLRALQASTLHRLLGRRPDSGTRFLHDRSNRLGHDLVVVDEASMVSLPLMAALLEALRPDAALVLVGDPDQLASVEAGVVLGDVVGPARHAARPPERLLALAGTPPDRVVGDEGAADPAPVTAGPTALPLPGLAAPTRGRSAIGAGIVVLRAVHRFGDEVATLARAVAAGDAVATLAALRRGGDAVRWVEDPDGDEVVRAGVVAAGVSLVESARAARPDDALVALGSHRVLCARRRGPGGVAEWGARVEGWLASAIPGYGVPAPWYPGRPLLVTANDPDVGLYNGDAGVVCVGGDGRATAVFVGAGGQVRVDPVRLGRLETLHVMTIHKSQGSQFGQVVVVLPPDPSPLVTRELLYTAVTRAVDGVTVIASEESVRLAVGTPITRASGLRERLWGSEKRGPGRRR